MKYYRKRYRLKNVNKLCIMYSNRGVTSSLYFGGANSQRMVKGFYETDDPSEQAFLESHPLFNQEFILEKTEPLREVEEAPVVKAAVVEEAPKYKEMSFPTVKACQEYISRELGLKGYLYSSYAKCKTVLKENGIIATFENENN